ncbi:MULTISPECIES: hypothetical protein [unclassified Sphingomonas]|uniref:hypothetical protein n=1 Tax=unclassified Sphingomonas TaxID=196159 RepID=UPI00070098A4|nr:MULTISPECIES: hypothetical protein [unclassified Sphingomonas]KQX19329.1 hypothetical protein ASD17_12360 [Sphingomonas sp. Root1294]KQY65532.1 hypothetical protein ASD39_15560 [Sphingomonas sp. Root50]KRB95168.1 hypothetical protein ASE22_04500 [Sphingomonas sp. Root720]
MTGLPEWLLPLLGGNTVLSAALGYFIPAVVSRKKDAGELGSDLLRQAIARIEVLEHENRECNTKAIRIESRCNRNELALRITIGELQERLPGSPVLRQVGKLIGPEMPTDSAVPADMTGILDQLNATTSRGI